MATTKTITDLLDHPRANVAWVCKPGRDSKGEPTIVRIARIVRVAPRDGMGRLWIGVTDWGPEGQDDAVQSISAAGGCGYDKVTAALAGARVGGIELGDHCDHKGRPTLDHLRYSQGWELIGGW